METVAKYPHEARVQRWGYGAILAAAALAALDAVLANGRLLGIDVPLAARLGLVAVGALVGLVAVYRRSTPIALAAAGLLVLGVLPAASAQPGLFGYARGLALGVLLLAFGELVHQTARYDRAHQLVEQEGASEEGLDRVTDEALKTLGTRTLLALAVAALGALGALGLATVGPASLREGLETASPVGAAVLSLLVFAIISMFILVRGSRFRREASPTQEVAADVPE